MHECESLDHLREILEANRSFETMLMQEKQKRKEIQDELQVIAPRLYLLAVSPCREFFLFSLLVCQCFVTVSFVQHLLVVSCPSDLH